MNNQAPSRSGLALQIGSISIVTTLVYLWLAVLGTGVRPFYLVIRPEMTWSTI
jgi:hypothetical protein